MLYVTHSNRLEILAGHLSEAVAGTLGDPFAPECILVPNPGMARWVAQEIARRSGVAANLEFPLPAAFFWRMLLAWLPDAPAQTAYQRDVLAWRIFRLLPGLLSSSEFTPLARYLDADPSDLRRLQLSRRIADTFDQYLIYRHDLCLAWEAGAEAAGWQSILWCALSAEAGGAHRARLVDDFHRAIAAGEPPKGPVPDRVSLFGLSGLAPVQIQMLGALASHTDVYLYYLNPCREYWADLEDDRRQAKRRAAARRASLPDPTGLLDVGNPLLAAFGHAGQIFLDQILELGGADTDAFDAPGHGCLLHRLQSDILDLIDRRRENPEQRQVVSGEDFSLRVHGVHGRQREIQVLHDTLLGLYAKLPGLEPRDIIVMAPDIDAYAPFIEAVFGTVPTAQRIPWAIADRGAGVELPMISAIELLLRLPRVRFEATTVLSLLQVPALRRRFGIDDEALERIIVWVQETGIRWGLNEGDRSRLDLPPVRENTWDLGLDRLFLGYAMPATPDQDLYAGVLPYGDIEGAEVAYLGALQGLVETLGGWRQWLAEPRPPAAWLKTINSLVSDFFTPDEDESEALTALHSTLDALLRQCQGAELEDPLSLDLIADWVHRALAESGGLRHFLSGRVTFCNMVPMRSIPFRVLCLIGMNGSDFPRSQRPTSFDLIARAPRRGDRSRRRDDRYLFLEALLSARDVLHISWVSNDVRDNSERVRSVVVDELLDYIAKSYRRDSGERLPDHLVVRHPLQPFSRRYFDGTDPRLATHAARWARAARVASSAQIAPFLPAALGEAEDAHRTLDVRDLIAFLRDPAGHFLHHRLGIRLPRGGLLIEDDEPFGVDHLQRYWLRDALIAERAAGRTPEDSLKRLRAAGTLPHGAVGEIIVGAQSKVIDGILARRERYAGQRVEPVEIDQGIGAFRLQGRLGGLADSGLVLSRPAGIKCKDRLTAWVLHLLLCALAPDGVRRRTVFVGEDTTLVLHPVEEPLAIIEDLLALRWQGLREPVPFFPQSSWEWFQSGELGPRFYEAWNGRGQQSGEGEDLAVRMAWRGRDPIGEEFMLCATRVLAPLDKHGELKKPAEESA